MVCSTSMSTTDGDKQAGDDLDDLTPEEEAELLRRSDEIPQNRRDGKLVPWEALAPRRPSSAA